MMKLRTEVSPAPFNFSIQHGDMLMFAGSCFSEHIQREMERLHFSVRPFSNGVIFHPLAIAKSLQDVIEAREYLEKDLIFHQEVWKSLNHHSSYNHSDKSTCLSRINGEIQAAHQHVKEVKVLFITFGSAVGYEYKANQTIVANCNKIPQQDFSKKLIDITEMYEALHTTFLKLKSINPHLQIVTTVSPVRHWKEGVVQNQRSKARLLMLCEQLELLDFCHYFPSYELMMDDLRDYRFYQTDMLHPSDQAVAYIKEKLFDVILNESSKLKILELEKWLRMQEHRGLNETPELTAKRKAEAAEQIRLILER